LPKGIVRLPATRTIVRGILIAVVLAVAIIYVGDFAWVRVRMMHPKPGNPFETVTALRILAIDEKGNKTEYSVDPLQPRQTAECVHALFPHNGDPPCWYLKRKFAQPIPMAIFPSAKNRRLPERLDVRPSLPDTDALSYRQVARRQIGLAAWQSPPIEIT
jgi:hypothetical protein